MTAEEWYAKIDQYAAADPMGGVYAKDRAIARVIREAVAAELEACARLAEAHPFSPTSLCDDGTREEIAVSIRARGTKEEATTP